MTATEIQGRLAERADRLLELARAGGADEAEVCASHVEEVQVRFEKGELKLTTVDEGARVGLRIFRERRLGFSATNQTDEASLARTAEDANSLARLSPPDEANVLPTPRGTARELSLASSDVATLDVGEVVALGRELVGRAGARDARLALEQASVRLARSTVAVHSTAGARAHEGDAALAVSVLGMAVDGDDVGGFDYWGGTVRSRDRIQATLEDTVERFVSAALGNLGAGAAESYRGPVLFSPAAFQSVFLSPLVSAASARAVQRGRSALAQKLGATIAVPGLTIVDDPHDVELNGVAAFDREGLPTARYPIVSEGVLRGFLYDGHAARVEGRESTAHAVGDTRSVPGIGAHGLVVSPGDGGDAADLRRTLGRGLLVGRFSGSVDPASGDFSGVAKSARWVESGEVVRSVRETLFSGNLFALLPQILALSSQTTSVMGAARVPWVLVDGVSVTAG